MLEEIKGSTLYEQLIEQIKDAIARGDYRKGDMLPSESELMQKTGVSRITVREALKVLSEAGVIETRKGKGSFVVVDPSGFPSAEGARKSLAEYRTFFMNSTRARLLLEPEIARDAAQHAGPAEIEAIGRTLPRRKRSADPENNFEQFHHMVAKAAGNPLIVSILDQLMQAEDQNELRSSQELRLVPPERQKIISAELDSQHRRIFTAIQEHDGEFAYFYMKEHMQFLMRSYKEYFDWFLQ